MHLSDSILLGDVLLPRNPARWLKSDCGCALGRGYLAAGGTQDIFDKIGLAAFMEKWPWLDANVMGQITCLFYDVCNGLRTIESLADHIKAIEPACGECNKHKCSCGDYVEQEAIYAGTDVMVSDYGCS